MMSDSPARTSLAMSVRIMQRWRQRMNGAEIGLLFLAASAALLYAGRDHSPAFSVPSLPDSPRHPLWEDFAITLSTFAAAVVVALLVALLLAGVSRTSRRVRVFLIPALSVGRATPGLGLLGLLAALFSPGLAVVFVAASGMVWRIATAALDAEEHIPAALEDVVQRLRLTEWQRFWRLQIPLAIPLMLDRAAASVPGVWFRLLCAQGLVVVMTHQDRGGAGARAVLGLLHARHDWLIEAILSALASVVAVDQGVMRPLLGWGQRYRVDSGPAGPRRDDGWMLRLWRSVGVMRAASQILRALMGSIANLRFGRRCSGTTRKNIPTRGPTPVILPVAAALCFLAAAWHERRLRILSLDALHGLLTVAHVCSALALSVVLWVPLGVLLARANGLTRGIVRNVASIGALVPAVLFYPFLRAAGHVPSAILMLLGAHWLIGLAVLDATQGIPAPMRQVVQGLRLRGPLLWRRVLFPLMAPDLFGSLLVAAIPLWNVVLIAETFARSGSTLGGGLGAMLVTWIDAGDLASQVPALTVLVLFSMLLDRLVLQPMAVHIAQKYALT